MGKYGTPYARMDRDAYYTPFWATDVLFGALAFHGMVYEPFAGAGHIIHVAHRHVGRRVRGADIHTPEDPVVEPDFIVQEDFFERQTLPPRWGLTHIVSNPIYGPHGDIAVRAIEHSLELTEVVGGTVTMLLPTDFDHGSTRTHIFEHHAAFDGQWKLLNRIQWANLEARSEPKQNCSWFHWDWQRDRSVKPFVGYLGRMAA